VEPGRGGQIEGAGRSKSAICRVRLIPRPSTRFRRSPSWAFRGSCVRHLVGWPGTPFSPDGRGCGSCAPPTLRVDPAQTRARRSPSSVSDRRPGAASPGSCADRSRPSGGFRDALPFAPFPVRPGKERYRGEGSGMTGGTRALAMDGSKQDSGGIHPPGPGGNTT